MRYAFLLIAMVCNSIFSFAHDVPIATFQITESESLLQLDVTFDLEDFSKSLDVEVEEIDLQYMKDYLSENTNFFFNGKETALHVSDVKIVRGHIRVKGNFGKALEKIETIKIKNICLNNVRHHSNHIQIDLNDKTKDYRMHKRRTEIKLKY
ncbi:MAG: hypothetical protein AB8F74_00235 [Saprospiraceae bacterium]